MGSDSWQRCEALSGIAPAVHSVAPAVRAVATAVRAALLVRPCLCTHLCSSGILMTKAKRSSMMVLRNLYVIWRQGRCATDLSL